ADPARLRRHVEGIVALGPRDLAHPDGLDRAAEWIAAALREHAPFVTTQAFAAGGRTYRNVVARFGPPSRERIVVGAHYDAAGALPGADDNASGVAGLLELARLLAASPPPGTIELVAFTLEEPPAFAGPEMGSAVHAASLAREGVAVRLMLSLEMIGFFTDAKGSQSFPAPGLGLVYPTTGNFIAVVGRLGEGRVVRRVRDAMRAATPLGVESIAAPRSLPGVDLSDHRSYWDRGWPAVMITDTAFFRNPNYHGPGDTPDTLDYARMAQVVTGVHAAVLDSARR
ncbi:MAG TPA: M28 family peptidase, partial [Anaeromyxobacteraceae bacterium]|nr:M28 family peptidase [Anaeromyxobacteraceae bacterium]